MKTELNLYEQNKIRSIYDEQKDTWYFSVVDVISVLIKKIIKQLGNTGISYLNV